MTATRLVLTGPLALAWRKKTDTRELYLLVEGEGWAISVPVDPKKGAEARVFAAKINAAASSQAAPAAAGAPAPEPSAPASSDALEQIRKLGELRDAGLRRGGVRRQEGRAPQTHIETGDSASNRDAIAVGVVSSRILASPLGATSSECAIHVHPGSLAPGHGTNPAYPWQGNATRRTKMHDAPDIRVSFTWRWQDGTLMTQEEQDRARQMVGQRGHGHLRAI